MSDVNGSSLHEQGSTRSEQGVRLSLQSNPVRSRTSETGEKGDERCDEWPNVEPKHIREDKIRRAGKKHRTTTNEEKKRMEVFVDTAAMKEKVRKNLTRPKYSVVDFYKDHGFAPQLATSPIFEHVTLGIIAVNAVWIAVDTDFNSSSILLQAHPVFIVVDNLFCGFFSFEWLVRFASFRRKRDGLKDAWFTFDSVLVAMMVLETWVMTLITLITTGAGGAGMGNTGILRMARLLRLSRMARMARLLRAMPELMILIKGMLAATRSVFFTLCLLVIIMYIFAIAMTQLTEDTSVGNRHFSTVGGSMYSLLLYGTLLDDIGVMSRDLGSEAAYLSVIFFGFVLLAALTVMNMLIGVLCEVVSAVAATEREEMLVGYVNGRLRSVVAILDMDGDNQISKREFVQILENSDAVRCLQEVGVDVVGLIDFADYIFEDEDAVDVDKQLTFSQFMDVVLQLRGTNNATVKDVVDLRKFLRRTLMKTNAEITLIREKLDQLCENAGISGRETTMSERTKTEPMYEAASCGKVSVVESRASCSMYGEASLSISSFPLPLTFEAEAGNGPIAPMFTSPVQLLTLEESGGDTSGPESSETLPGRACKVQPTGSPSPSDMDEAVPQASLEKAGGGMCWPVSKELYSMPVPPLQNGHSGQLYSMPAPPLQDGYTGQGGNAPMDHRRMVDVEELRCHIMRVGRFMAAGTCELQKLKDSLPFPHVVSGDARQRGRDGPPRVDGHGANLFRPAPRHRL